MLSNQIQIDEKNYIESATGIPEDGNRFFNQHIIHIRNPWDMISVGLRLLHKCYETNPEAYANIYKGGLFFYLGLASFRLQDYEIALFFIDNAVSSDVIARINPVIAPSHAMRLIQLNSTLPEHKDFIGDAETRIKDVIRIYNSRSKSKNLNITNLREKFLQPAMTTAYQKWRTLATTFISFCLEWNYRDELFTICPDSSTSEPYFLHLFKGCVLFESLLKENNSPKPWRPTKPRDNTLGKVLEYYSAELGSTSNLGENIKGPDLNTIVNDLQNTNMSIFSAIKFTARLRNTVGHNLGWGVSLNKDQYQQLFQMATSSCLHTIACLYA